MGTSSIYGGPIDKNPLLPEGFEDEYINDDALDTDNPDNETEEKKDNEEEEEGGGIFSLKMVLGKKQKGPCRNI